MSSEARGRGRWSAAPMQPVSLQREDSEDSHSLTWRTGVQTGLCRSEATDLAPRNSPLKRRVRGQVCYAGASSIAGSLIAAFQSLCRLAFRIHFPQESSKSKLIMCQQVAPDCSGMLRSTQPRTVSFYPRPSPPHRHKSVLPTLDSESHHMTVMVTVTSTCRGPVTGSV